MIALGPRVRTRLGELRLENRISWQDYADFQADVVADTELAVEQALEDHARFSLTAAQAHHFAVCLELLKTVPYRVSAYYEPRSFATFERKPEPDFSRPGDVIDVEPADVPDLPGLDAVADAPSITRARSAA